MKRKPLAIDLFCGAGGMSEGVMQAGFHIVFSSDINKDIQETYTNRHKQLGFEQGIHTHFQRADVRQLTGRKILWWINKLKCFEKRKIKEIDAIFGGPPCQGFSRAGKRDKSDPRNILFREYIRIVSEIKPRYVIMENVEGFLDTTLDNFIGHSGKRYPANSKVTSILTEEFNKMYGVSYIAKQPVTIDASEYGVPQKRKRVIFCAYRCDQVEPVIPPINKTPHRISVKEAIGDYGNTKMSSAYISQSKAGRTPNINGRTINSKGVLLNSKLSKHIKDVVQRFSIYQPGETKRTLTQRILTEGIDLASLPELVESCARKVNVSSEEIIAAFRERQIDSLLLEALLTQKNSRVRLLGSETSPTVMTLPDDFIHYEENRILSVREMARLQSFDDSFEFKGKRTTGGHRRKSEIPQYTQVGNAVPPLLAKQIAETIYNALNLKKIKTQSLLRRSL